MAFCSHCGEELPENAYFCLKCGSISSKGVESGASYPWNWEKELEKTFSIVAEEVRSALNNVQENILKTAGLLLLK